MCVCVCVCACVCVCVLGDCKVTHYFKIGSYFSIPPYIYICKVKLATLVEGDPKAPFSIATTPRCRGGRNSIPWIAPLYP